jgi:hypothetical protein
MLSWANMAAGWWTSAAVREMRRQQRAMLTAMTKPGLATKSRSRKPRKR